MRAFVPITQIITRLIVFSGVLAGSLLSSSAARADTVTVTLLELQNALDNATQQPDQVSRDLLDRITQALNESDIGFSNGEVLYQDSAADIPIDGGCNNTEILQLNTNIVLASDTSLSLTLNSLYEPIILAVAVQANVNSNGSARNIVGIRLGDCQNIARDTFQFDANGQASFSLSVSLSLNPEWSESSVLSLFPTLSLDGELAQFSSTVDVDDSVLASLLEDYIEGEIEDTFTNSRLSAELQNFELTLNEKLSESLDNGRLDIELPESDDEQVLALYRLLQPEARFPITLDMIRLHRRELLASILFGEPTSPTSIFADALLCESASSFFSTTQTTPIFTGGPAQCSQVTDVETVTGQVWSDANCQQALDYSPTSVSAYCNVALDSDRLGNAASNPLELQRFTHSPGTRFDISALTSEGLIQPFMQRFNYKQVDTPRGSCELEMRVYSLSAVQDSTDRKALLALHGGSWQARASGFIGVEAMATHFANEGFTVFAPFYRLIGDTDGNIACNDANLNDILDDVNDALDWVQQRADSFGLRGKTTVFGQSAGGHLALSLATHRAEEIRRAILFYAPTDFTDFAEQIRSGAYTNPTGLKILEAVTGSSIDALDTSSALVRNNSFPMLVSQAAVPVPPMFILHGEMDTLLDYRQSVRLCNALSGSTDFNTGPALSMPNMTTLASRVQCDANGSQLHLIAEGEHALDLCIAPSLCLSGSTESADEVAQSISAMLEWSSAESLSANASGGGSSFLGSLSYWYVFSLWLLLLVRFELIHKRIT